LYEEEQTLRERCLEALPLPASLHKKMAFSLERGLVKASVRTDARVTPADFRELARVPALKELSGFERLPPERLTHLASCPNVQALTFGDTRPLTEADWQAVVGLEQVERLRLSSGKITDEDLRHLAVMPQLKEVDLREASVTDAGLAHLAGLTNLEVLRLYEASVTDAGLAHLSGLRRLKVLSLPYTDVTDAGLVHLLPLKCLTSLDLCRTNIKGDPAPILVKLRKLRYVRLDHLGGVNDASTKQLARLPALRELSLRRTGVTRFRLSRLLPKTKWKKIHLETSLDVVQTPEEKEVEAFVELCREQGVFVEVDYE
jgi:hypothetical protein